MNNLNGVLLGAGFFARFHADAWMRMPGVELVAVADVAPGRAQEFASEFAITRAYESVEAMFNAERPDFVDIATRPDTHLPLTRLAASRGIHVICQKPMSPTMADNIAMCEACEAAGVRLLIHENWRWQPWYREAKRIIDAGALGTLTHLAFDWRTGDGNGPEPYAEQPYFREMPRLLIHESLVHILDTFRYLAGEFAVTACRTQRENPVIAGEDWAEIEVSFAKGAKGFIHGDRQTGPMPTPVAMGTMTVEGERGSLRVLPTGEVFLRDERLPFEPPTLGYKGDSVKATQCHLIECLRSGQPAESEGRDYLIIANRVEDCYRLSEL